MLDEINKFGRIIYMILIVLLGVVLICAIAELVWMIVSGLFTPSISLLDNREIVTILGSFLLVLITVELLDTIPGVAQRIAEVIVSEIGSDMSGELDGSRPRDR